MEERIIELELRSSEQQRLQEELSAVLHAQQQELDRLRAEVASLRSRIDDAPSIGPAEKPPHF
jgi:uncharacterized coiled-coil protein SlyX